jgi:fused signal recognition particle receptor
LEKEQVNQNLFIKLQEVSMGFFDRLKSGLQKTRKNVTEKIDQVLVSFGKIDDDLFDELEEVLITSDVGIDTTLKIIDDLKKKVKETKTTDPLKVKDLLKEELAGILTVDDNNLNIDSVPSIIIVIGVNGVGKTTSIGKIANLVKQQGKKVLLAAGDTFRAAAIDQLEIWAKRVEVDIIKHSEGSDPAAVIYDAIQAAKSRNVDVLICDTAGRLHNKKNLMEELKKISKIIERELPDASKETLLVLDATTGQNAISQAKNFSESANISGIVLTKLDGTAKGGIVIAIKSELDIPIKLIGVGESMEDLQNFDPKEFVDALFA